MSNAEEMIEEQMSKNPVGMVTSFGKKTASAVFWTDRETAPKIMAHNFVTGFAQQAIDKGVWTKKDAIESLESTLKDR